MAKKAMAHSVKYDVWRKMDSSILIETVGNYRWERERAMHRKMEASQIQNTKQALLKKMVCYPEARGLLHSNHHHSRSFVCSLKIILHGEISENRFFQPSWIMGVFGLQASVDHRSANHPLAHARRTRAGHNNISESGIEETWDLGKCFFWLSFCWRQQSCLRWSTLDKLYFD